MLGRKQNRSHLIDRARQETVTMLDKAHQVFGLAWQILTEDGESEHLSRLDREINEGERMVRRLVIEHLTMNPDQELPTSLTLVSIVHDVERLGDYAKSIAELRDMSDVTLATEGLGQRCRDVQAEIEPMFQLAIEGITDDDEAKAADLMAQHRAIKAQTDTITSDAVANEQSDRSDLLAVLVSRYLRRVSAHLSNVVSSIVNPFDLISRND
jgi:phosphate transport system protein